MKTFRDIVEEARLDTRELFPWDVEERRSENDYARPIPQFFYTINPNEELQVRVLLNGQLMGRTSDGNTGR